MATATSGGIRPLYGVIIRDKCKYADLNTLKAYKTDNSAAVGRNNAIMGAMARQFSNADLKALAQYIGSLDGELKTVPESRFHQQ